MRSPPPLRDAEEVGYLLQEGAVAAIIPEVAPSPLSLLCLSPQVAFAVVAGSLAIDAGRVLSLMLHAGEHEIGPLSASVLRVSSRLEGAAGDDAAGKRG